LPGQIMDQATMAQRPVIVGKPQPLGFPRLVGLQLGNAVQIRFRTTGGCPSGELIWNLGARPESPNDRVVGIAPQWKANEKQMKSHTLEVFG